MPSRHPRLLPRLWLMTDERQGERLFDALAALPAGSGVIFRHRSLAAAERRSLFARVRRITRRRRLLLIWAGSPAEAARNRADGVHGWGTGQSARPMIRTAPTHSRRQLVRAERLGVDLAFLSPLFPTRSHPGARTLGRVRFNLIARSTELPLIALGGITADPRIPVIWGWAAIDSLTPKSKRPCKNPSLLAGGARRVSGRRRATLRHPREGEDPASSETIREEAGSPPARG